MKNVLHKIEDLHIQDPQKGVEIAKTLLGQPEEHSNEHHKILYLSQMGKLYIKEKAE
ncbi:MAG: hypothetical protein LBD75_03580 [Candidatus Peribacteria bacterium]|nr:hypothetical protein [Candidatus Peribacteria bacterium]